MPLHNHFSFPHSMYKQNKDLDTFTHGDTGMAIDRSPGELRDAGWRASGISMGATMVYTRRR